MRQLDLTRDQFAARLKIKPRRLAAWLLPDGSNERRPLPIEIRHHVESLVRDACIFPISSYVKNAELATQGSLITCPENGVVFPTVYRVTGYGHDIGELMKGNEKKGLPIKPFYALKDESKENFPYGQFEVTCTPITHLDPELDTGWVIVRHHMNESEATGYVQALMDIMEYETDNKACLYKTDQAIFTVIHRDKSPDGEDHLLIFESKYKAYNPYFGPDTENAWSKIIGPEGRELSDNALFPSKPL